MSNMKAPAIPGLVASLFMLVLLPALFSPQPAVAQLGSELPAELYGSGLPAGAVVAAHIGGTECDSATVEDNGWWLIRVNPGDCDGGAVEGARVTFTIDGQQADQVVIWMPSYRPQDLDNGIRLTVGSGAGSIVVDADGPPEPSLLSRTKGLAIFSGGSLDELEAAALAACPGGATIWANDPAPGGQYLPFFPNPPIPLLNQPFRASYPDGFDGPEPVIVTGCE